MFLGGSPRAKRSRLAATTLQRRSAVAPLELELCGVISTWAVHETSAAPDDTDQETALLDLVASLFSHCSRYDFTVATEVRSATGCFRAARLERSG
jgi:hypothetical protein